MDRSNTELILNLAYRAAIEEIHEIEMRMLLRDQNLLTFPQRDVFRRMPAGYTVLSRAKELIDTEAKADSLRYNKLMGMLRELEPLLEDARQQGIQASAKAFAEHMRHDGKVR